MATHLPFSILGARALGTALVLALGVTGCTSALASGRHAPFSTEAERCIWPASLLHQVNPHVLRAILVVESRLEPRAVHRNSNATVDLGIGQINSIHFRELARHGITPDHLLDACIGTYVAAWHLRRQLERHGNTWFGVGAYHSVTPAHNQRYQGLIYRELRRSGSADGHDALRGDTDRSVSLAR